PHPSAPGYQQPLPLPVVTFIVLLSSHHHPLSTGVPPGRRSSPLTLPRRKHPLLRPPPLQPRGLGLEPRELLAPLRTPRRRHDRPAPLRRPPRRLRDPHRPEQPDPAGHALQPAPAHRYLSPRDDPQFSPRHVWCEGGKGWRAYGWVSDYCRDDR